MAVTFFFRSRCPAKAISRIPASTPAPQNIHNPPADLVYFRSYPYLSSIIPTARLISFLSNAPSGAASPKGIRNPCFSHAAMISASNSGCSVIRVIILLLSLVISYLANSSMKNENTAAKLRQMTRYFFTFLLLFRSIYIPALSHSRSHPFQASP